MQLLSPKLLPGLIDHFACANLIYLHLLLPARAQLRAIACIVHIHGAFSFSLIYTESFCSGGKPKQTDTFLVELWDMNINTVVVTMTSGTICLVAGKNVDLQLPQTKKKKVGGGLLRDLMQCTNIWLTCVTYVSMCAVSPGGEEGDPWSLLLLLLST